MRADIGAASQDAHIAFVARALALCGGRALWDFERGQLNTAAGMVGRYKQGLGHCTTLLFTQAIDGTQRTQADAMAFGNGRIRLALLAVISVPGDRKSTRLNSSH